jgi:UPF0755 protein
LLQFKLARITRRKRTVRIVGGILKAIISVAMIGAVLVAGFFIYTQVSPLVASTGRCAGTSAGPVVFVVKPGETVSQVADDLERACIISNALTFKLRVQVTGTGDKFQAGSFTVTPGSDYDTILKVLTTSQAIASTRITVIEGLRLEEVADYLAGQHVVDTTSFLSKTTTPEGAAVYSDTFLAQSGKPADKGLEGFLFPDTYDIARHSDDDSDTVIKTMLHQLESKFTPDLLAAIPQRQIDGQPANVYQILTLASIIQREGVISDELPIISSVYWNRLAEGTVLNADPTSQYANGKSGAWWPADMTLEMLHIKNPYNTYDNRGLPPGPICNPGLLAIQAAINPADTKYLYFVAKNDGSGTHAFATTYDEQQRNIAKYQKP